MIMDKENNQQAGDFKSWLEQSRKALQNDQGMDVPCGSCTACCKSSYFIHIRPDEKKTLEHIPKELLFPAPGMPAGQKVLGFNEKGHCPMLKNNKCTIYETRPLTCRSYDCRVFCATGLPPGTKKKALIHEQVERWGFTFSNDSDKQLYNTVRKTAKFLVENRKKFPKDFIPSNITQLAVLAIKIYPLFIAKKTSDLELIQRIINTVKD